MATLLEAALQILAESHGPLSVDEITERAKEQGLLSSTSKTPAASMGATLYIDVKKNPDSPFLQTGPRQFSLKPGVKPARTEVGVKSGSDFAGQAAQHNQLIKEKLLGALKAMDPQAFEHLIARLLERLGYDGVEVTKYSGDGGIDINATLTVGGVTSVPTAVQVKRYESNVSGKVVRELRGSIGVHERGLIMTTAGFTKDALAEANAPNKAPIALVDGKKLVDLLAQKGVGVVSREVEILDLDLESLEPAEAGEGGTGTKYQSVWPLPGGDYLSALNAMLEYVLAESPTLEIMMGWIKAKFPSVESTKVANSYIRFVRHAGLLAYEGSKLALTADGATYLAHSDCTHLLDLFCSRFLGMDELVELLVKTAGTLDELNAALIDRIKVQWSTNAQTRYRLDWLRAVGTAERNSQGVWSAKM